MLDPGHVKVSKTLILRNYKLGGRTKFLSLNKDKWLTYKELHCFTRKAKTKFFGVEWTTIWHKSHIFWWSRAKLYRHGEILDGSRGEGKVELSMERGYYEQIHRSSHNLLMVGIISKEQMREGTLTEAEDRWWGEAEMYLGSKFGVPLLHYLIFAVWMREAERGDLKIFLWFLIWAGV